MPGLPPMAMVIASAPWIATARSSRRTKSFRILFWHLAGTRQIAGDVAKTFSTTKLLDKIAAHYRPAACMKCPSDSSTSAS